MRGLERDYERFLDMHLCVWGGGGGGGGDTQAQHIFASRAITITADLPVWPSRIILRARLSSKTNPAAACQSMSMINGALWEWSIRPRASNTCWAVVCADPSRTSFDHMM
jgi:hypothetical protein